MKTVLGLSCYYHDSAAALIKDGRVIAAAQEERFTRKKHDESFPTHAIEFCLKEASLDLDQIDAVIFYDKPMLKFERILETYLTVAPRGFSSFIKAIPVWVKDKLWTKADIRQRLGFEGPIYFTEHHMSHAASAFFPSPFEEAVIITADGVGEWATTSIGIGKGNHIQFQQEIHFPHSLGLLYSAFTYYTGFKVNSGEYKVMGLAPYGRGVYTEKILQHLIDIKEDGSFRMDMSYFNYLGGLTMTNKKFHDLFGSHPRKPESPLEQRHMDLARSVQEVTELVMEKIVRFAINSTGIKKVCLAGGVALNCVSNGKLVKKLPIEDVFIQPAAGDAGGALGAALYGWYQIGKQPRTVNLPDALNGSFLGPQFNDPEIESFLSSRNIPYHKMDRSELMEFLAHQLKSECVVGLFQGKMEFGPRALGGRSILGDARSQSMQKTMNLKIKYRESFRPFAPILLREELEQFFDCPFPSPYMLLVADILEKHRLPMTAEQERLFGIEKLNIPRSSLPAITHVDYSARLQTVEKEQNPFMFDLLTAFKKKTGVGILVNTSFNVRGEPIVCTPEDAYRCFMRTEMDLLVVENYVLKKEEQPATEKNDSWKTEFALD